jgi:peptide/nickel transport system substrate-binding protein
MVAGAVAMLFPLLFVSNASAQLHRTSRIPAASASSLTFTRIGGNTTGFGPVRQDTGSDAVVNSLMFSNLVKVAPNENKVLPDLAVRWTASKGGQVYTFFLRKGVKWSDGKPFTAADVVFTITQAAQFGPDPYIGYQPVDWRLVEGASAIVGTHKPLAGVKAIGDYEVQITLSQPYAWFIRDLTDAVYSIVPEHILKSATAKNITTLPFTTNKPVGTGPYTLTAAVPNQYYEFKANPHYFMGKPKIETLFFKLGVTDASAVAQIQSGEMQLVLDFDPTDIAVLKHVNGVVAKYKPSEAAEFIEFRCDNPQVANALVREAVFYAIDRRTMLKQFAAGEGKVLWTMPGFDQSAPGLNHYPFDPKKAKQLLAKAHFNFSKPFVIDYSPTLDPLWPQMSLAIQAYLKAVGIKAVLNPLAPTAWVSAITSPTPQYALTLNSGGSMGLRPDISSIYFNCHHPLASYYANCALDDLYAKAGAAINTKAQKRLYAQIGLLLNKQVPFPALWQTSNLDAWTNRLGGTFTVFPNDRDTAFNVSGWTLSQ